MISQYQAFQLAWVPFKLPCLNLKQYFNNQVRYDVIMDKIPKIG